VTGVGRQETILLYNNDEVGEVR